MLTMLGKAYLDTKYLKDIVSDKKQERSEALHLLAKVKKSFEVVVPQVVGVLFSIIARNSDRNGAYKKMKTLIDHLYDLINPNMYATTQ